MSGTRPAAATLEEDDFVTWYTWLILAALGTAAAAVTGIKPKGARPVARTQMMGMARLALVVLVLIFVYLAWQARSGL